MTMAAVPTLQCSDCGACVEAACDCGVAYVTARERAAAAVAKAPEKSDRAIAAEIGLGHATVSRARVASGVSDETSEKRTGKDGKQYPVTQPAKEPTKARLRRDLDDRAMPTEKEAEDSWQSDLYDQACLLLERMAEPTRQRFVAHIEEPTHENKKPNSDPTRGSTPNAEFQIRAKEALTLAKFKFKMEIDERSLKAARATASAWSRKVEEMEQYEHARKTCVALYQQVLAAEREKAQFLLDHPNYHPSN